MVGYLCFECAKLMSEDSEYGVSVYPLQVSSSKDFCVCCSRITSSVCGIKPKDAEDLNRVFILVRLREQSA